MGPHQQMDFVDGRDWEKRLETLIGQAGLRVDARKRLKRTEDWRIGGLEQVICEGLGNSMSEGRVQVIMDYTTVPIGLWVVGMLWTGRATRFTATCPSCGRIGVISAPNHAKRIVVHTGSVAGNTLTGIDYCELGNEEKHLSRIDRNSRLHLTPESRTQGHGVIYAAAIAVDEARPDNQRKNYARDVDESTVSNRRL